MYLPFPPNLIGISSFRPRNLPVLTSPPLSPSQRSLARNLRLSIALSTFFDENRLCIDARHSCSFQLEGNSLPTSRHQRPTSRAYHHVTRAASHVWRHISTTRAYTLAARAQSKTSHSCSHMVQPYSLTKCNQKNLKYFLFLTTFTPRCAKR